MFTIYHLIKLLFKAKYTFLSVVLFIKALSFILFLLDMSQNTGQLTGERLGKEYRDRYARFSMGKHFVFG